MELLQNSGGGRRVLVMCNVTGFENLSISSNSARKFCMNMELVGLSRVTGFAVKSQDFSPSKKFMNTKSGVYRQLIIFKLFFPEMTRTMRRVLT
jgi:hypothetical protein